MKEVLKVFGIKEVKEGIPELVSKGEKEAAEIIINKAKKEGIDIVQDKNLAELLGKVDMYEGIPEEAYKIISEVLMYIYKLEKEGNIE